MISFAQNCEDVLLERCFAKKGNGRYVDIGAGHPLRDSVTYWFYRRGWSGLNVDASGTMHQLLSRFRPRDINIRALVLDEVRQVVFFDTGLSGLSSVRQRNAAHAEKRGFAAPPEPLTSVTLSKVLEQHGVAAIDFLKIDVEGAELEVMRGLDLDRWRPNVMVIEAIDAVNQRYCNEPVVDHLQRRGYERVYFDGLNDYFVADECGALRENFATPVNLFDNFVRWSDTLNVPLMSSEARAFQERLDVRMRRHWTSIPIEVEAHIEAEFWARPLIGREIAREDVERAYLDILCRAASADEIESWLATIASNDMTVANLIEALLKSEEYCRKALEFGRL